MQKTYLLEPRAVPRAVGMGLAMLVMALLLFAGAPKALAAEFAGYPAWIAYVNPASELHVLRRPAYLNEEIIDQNPHSGVQPGTNPSIGTEPLSGQYQVAFAANGTDGVWIDENNVSHNEELGMAANTSPSMSPYRGTFAFQANTTALWENHSNTGLGMMKGTSPAVAANGVVAVQANTGELWIYVPGQGGHGTGLGMASGTSPSIVETGGGNWTVAFHASGTNLLWTYNNLGQGVNTGLGVQPGSSPAITECEGSPIVAFEAYESKELWTYRSGVGTNRHAGMLGGTSPSITCRVAGTWEVAFHGARENRLETYSPWFGTVLTGKTLRGDDSPSIGS